LAPGVTSRFDRANVLTVRLAGGALSSHEDVRALSNANALAIGGPENAWEIMLYANAEYVGDGVWRLSRLVRGLGGEEHLSQRTLAPGAPVVVLNEAVTALVSDPAFVGTNQTLRFADASGGGQGGMALAQLPRPGAAALSAAQRAVRVAFFLSVSLLNLVAVSSWWAHLAAL
jgi:hypothetical protein